MPKIFSDNDIRIGLLFLAICMVFVIIGTIIWGIHPPKIGVAPKIAIGYWI